MILVREVVMFCKASQIKQCDIEAASSKSRIQYGEMSGKVYHEMVMFLSTIGALVYDIAYICGMEMQEATGKALAPWFAAISDFSRIGCSSRTISSA